MLVVVVVVVAVAVIGVDGGCHPKTRTAPIPCLFPSLCPAAGVWARTGGLAGWDRSWRCGSGLDRGGGGGAGAVACGATKPGRWAPLDA